MKKRYLKPEQHINVVEMEDLMQLQASAPVVGGNATGGASKDREDFEGEGDSGWGTLW